VHAAKQSAELLVICIDKTGADQCLMMHVVARSSAQFENVSDSFTDAALVRMEALQKDFECMDETDFWIPDSDSFWMKTKKAKVFEEDENMIIMEQVQVYTSVQSRVDLRKQKKRLGHLNHSLTRVVVLQEMFDKCPFPNTGQKILLGRELKMSYVQVQTWFINHRKRRLSAGGSRLVEATRAGQNMSRCISQCHEKKA